MDWRFTPKDIDPAVVWMQAEDAIADRNGKLVYWPNRGRWWWRFAQAYWWIRVRLGQARALDNAPTVNETGVLFTAGCPVREQAIYDKWLSPEAMARMHHYFIGRYDDGRAARRQGGEEE